MGYDRDYGRDRGGYRGNDDQRNRFGRDEGHPRERGHGDDDRGFFDRAGDEVRSWFGDEEAERRRRYDENNEQRERGSERSDYGRPSYQDRSRADSYGRSSGGSEGGGRYGQSQSASSASSRYGQHGGSDYDRWRQQQIDALDRDYDEYRRENASRFESDFGGWRSKRQNQRSHLGRVGEHMEVVGSDGQHVGKVDKVRGDRIILAKSDPAAGGHHHSIPCSWIETVDDKVTISKTADEAQREWRDEERRQALFSEDQERNEGPHMLNRSFSGTYEK